jgi:hypothetical protein
MRFAAAPAFVLPAFVSPRFVLRAFVSLALAAALLPSTQLLAADGDGEIADGAAFFSAKAVSEASDIIDSIVSMHDRDVRVETYAQVPEHLRDDLARDGREKFYDDWLNRRARELGVRGIFILITRTPGRIQVGVDKATQRRAFPADDRDALREGLATAFRAKRYDQGLLDGLKFLRRRLDENTARERNGSVPVASAWK